MADVSDMELLRDYNRQGSEEAFAALVHRHVNLVYSVALRHAGIAANAEEITQAVFVILARKAASLRPDTVLEGWLHETTRLTALQFMRGERRRQFREQEAYMQSTLPESADAATWNQLAPLLDDALSRLGQKDRDAVMLRFFKDQSVREVAVALKISERAAQRRVLRAVEKLRLFFTKRGVVHSSAVLTATISAHSIQTAPAGLAKTVATVALAKGATAGGSTLTLIKGALKLMAWTKAKTAVVATIVVLVAVPTTTVVVKEIHAARVAAYPNIVGAWEGVVHFDDPGVVDGKNASTRMVLKFAKTHDGYSATSDWIDMGRKDVPMGRVIYEYPSLQVERNPREGAWKLTVKPGAKEMVWDRYIHFIQPDPVVLKRTVTPDQMPERLVEDDFAPQAGSDLQGYWTGSIGIPPEALPVAIKIAEQADGTFRAEADSISQGVKGQPIAVTYNPPTVKLLIATGKGMVQGEINKAHTQISGSFIQTGQSIPAILKRTDYQAEHAQDAVKDYSHKSENDLQGHWMGTWTLPFAKVMVKMRYALDIAKLPDGTFSAELANIDEFGYDAPIPASDFRWDPEPVRIEWKWYQGAFGGNGVFEGQIKNGKLAGTWFQGGGRFPLVFERRAAYRLSANP